MTILRDEWAVLTIDVARAVDPGAEISEGETWQFTFWYMVVGMVRGAGTG